MEANLILQSITLVGIIFIWYYKKNKIGSMKQTISDQQIILSALKTFSDVIKIDEIKKYVDLTNQNIRMEAEADKQKFEEELRQQISKVIPASLDLSQAIKEYKVALVDLIALVFAFSLNIPEKFSERIFESTHIRSEVASNLIATIKKRIASGELSVKLKPITNS